MESNQQALRFSKPELSLGNLFGILFVLLSAGLIILLLFYSLASKLVFLLALVVFLIFLYLVIRGLINSRFIYVDQNTVIIKYRLGLKSTVQYDIRTCTGFFPYKHQFRTRYANGWLYGVTLFFEDNFTLKLRAQWYRDDIYGVIEILKNLKIKNLNLIADYDITGYTYNNFSFVSLATTALKDMAENGKPTYISNDMQSQSYGLNYPEFSEIKKGSVKSNKSLLFSWRAPVLFFIAMLVTAVLYFIKTGWPSGL